MPVREHEVAWDAMWRALRAAATGTAVPNLDCTAVSLGEQQGAPGLVALGLGDEPVAGSRAPHETLRVLHAALGEARIPHVFFKGPFADLVLWGGQGLRGGQDVDVLVPRKDEERALAALSGAGFTLAKSHGLDASAAASKARRLLPLDRALREVDLHLRPLNDPPFPARAEDVLACARDYLVDGAAIPGPDPAVMLVWSAGNLAGGRLQGLVRQAADAARIAHLFSIDWSRVVSTARAWRASAATWGFLRLLEERLGVDVPREPLAALAPPAPVGRVIERAFGVAGAPLSPDNVILGIFAVEWALSGRALWPAERILRTGALRIADHVLDALEGSRAPALGANVAGATPQGAPCRSSSSRRSVCRPMS